MEHHESTNNLSQHMFRLYHHISKLHITICVLFDTFDKLSKCYVAVQTWTRAHGVRTMDQVSGVLFQANEASSATCRVALHTPPLISCSINQQH